MSDDATPDASTSDSSTPDVSTLASNHGQALTAERFNEGGAGTLPALLGIVITSVGDREIGSTLAVRADLMAPNGYLHAGAIVTLADTAAGYGCVANMPAEATGFTTIELKSNHVSTARGGNLDCVARAVHIGRTTQVWDASVTHRETGKLVAVFRCTQIVLYG